jgi:uncharacterized protein YacL
MPNSEIITITIVVVSQLATLALVWSRLDGSNKPSLAQKKNSRSLILDTCALIDGRILELAKAGFVPETLIIPRFILRELQMLADGSDAHKRERARFGLSIAEELREVAGVEVEVYTSPKYDDSTDTVDDRLLALALEKKTLLYTTDFNLNKVATVEGVRVLNINELSQNIRSNYLPGERFDVKIIQKGDNRDQGVGYTPDGTMIVIDGAARLIGQTKRVEVTRVFQTVAGKMLFAILLDRPDRPERNPKQHPVPKPEQLVTAKPAPVPSGNVF